MALSERALARLARERERLVEQVVERLAVQVALAERGVALAQLVVRLELELGLIRVDELDLALELLELLALAHAERAVQNRHIRMTVASYRDRETIAPPRVPPAASRTTVAMAREARRPLR